MYRIIKIAVCLLAATLVCSAALADSVSLTQGVNGYTGMSQGEIRSYIWGGGGYTTPAYAIPGRLFLDRSWTPGYKARLFLKWDLQGIVPTGYAVTGAQLTMTRYYQVDSSNGADPTINVHKALQPWTEGQVTWMNWSDGGRVMDPANTPYGVLQDPNPEYVGQVMGTIPSLGNWTTDADSNNQFTVNLDTAVIQDWINNPTTNYGVFVKYAVDDTVNDTYSYWWDKTNANAAYRPMLTLQYAPVPEPSAVVSFVGFLAGSGILALRRRK